MTSISTLRSTLLLLLERLLELTVDNTNGPYRFVKGSFFIYQNIADFVLFWTDSSLNCFEEQDDDTCVKLKTTSENTVKLTLLKLESGEKYFVCVKTFGVCEKMRSCSNGFVVDLEPPKAGQVEIGNRVTIAKFRVNNLFSKHLVQLIYYFLENLQKNCQLDSTSLRISWNSFVDKRTKHKTGYVHGIKSYEVSSLGARINTLHEF